MHRIKTWTDKIKIPRWIKFDNPLLSIRAAFRVMFLRLKRTFRADSSFYVHRGSTVKIDIFMPTLEKDAKVLPVCLKYAKKFIKHPIGNIYIISPRSAKQVRHIAKSFGCVWIDEESILPITKKDINYIHNGEDRAGWVFKMLLNLSADKVCKEKNILVLDSDTVFLRPQIFIYKGKPIFNESPLYHKPYFNMNIRLFGLRHPSSLSYITHYMLFNSEILKSLRSDIEKHNNSKRWYEAIINKIDTREGSGFADYEIYADYYLHRLKKSAVINYWLVKDSGISNYETLLKLKKTLSNKYGAVALHNYDRNE